MKVPLTGMATSVQALAQWVSTLASSVAVGWNVNHHEDGTHKFDWVDVPFTSTRYTGSGSMTWTVDPSDQSTLAYRYLTPTEVLIVWSITTSDVGGTPSTDLRIALPDRMVATHPAGAPHWYRDAGTEGVGLATVSGGTSIVLRKSGAGNWTSTTSDNTWTIGQMVIRVKGQ